MLSITPRDRRHQDRTGGSPGVRAGRRSRSGISGVVERTDAARIFTGEVLSCTSRVREGRSPVGSRSPLTREVSDPADEGRRAHGMRQATSWRLIAGQGIGHRSTSPRGMRGRHADDPDREGILGTQFMAGLPALGDEPGLPTRIADRSTGSGTRGVRDSPITAARPRWIRPLPTGIGLTTLPFSPGRPDVFPVSRRHQEQTQSTRLRRKVKTTQS